MEKLKIVAVTQARVGSTRLPGKVLMKLGNESLLQLHVRRIKNSKKIDELIVATTTAEEDAAIVSLVDKTKANVYRGSVEDVLDRFYQALQGKGADYVVRLTADCPLIDGSLIDKVIQFTIEHNLDYCSNTLETCYPDGEDIEVFRYSALEKAWNEAKLSSEREHVTPFIWKNSSYRGGALFKSDNFSEGYSYGHLRLTVDEETDFILVDTLISKLGIEKTWLEYAEFLEMNNDIKAINSSITRNEGYSKSIKKEEK